MEEDTSDLVSEGGGGDGVFVSNPTITIHWTRIVWNGFLSFGKNVTVEPIMFLQEMALHMTIVIIQNLYIDRVCRITLQQSVGACSHLTKHGKHDGDLESQVEKEVSQLMIYQNWIIAIPAIIFVLYLGVWSDKHGYKLPMVMALFGYTFSSLAVFVITLLLDLRPEYIFISLLPIVLTGGHQCLATCAYSFMGANVPSENRTFRISVMQFVWYLGQPIGTMAGAKIFALGSFKELFLTTATVYALTFLYAIVFMPEPSPAHHGGELNSNAFGVFSIRECFSTIFKDRPHNLNRWIKILWITFVLRVMILKSNDLIYLYVRNKLNWDEQVYSDFKTVGVILDLIGSYSLPLIGMKIFNVGDITIGFFSGLGFFIASFVFAFATTGWMMYLGTFIQMFCGLQTMIIRSMLSKCVESDEMGKLMGFLACTDAALPLLVTPLVNTFYNHTLHIFPGAFYLIQSAFNGIIILNFVYLATETRHNNNQNPIPVED